MCFLQRVVNELIVAFLGSLPLVTRPQSRPIAPLLSCADSLTARALVMFHRRPRCRVPTRACERRGGGGSFVRSSRAA
ncbi:exported protein of unknown function [Modestobacter italicus]|uniref:Uncharacterized protein n=1 Tax=Modestobacter italicus (strain DSM 44449 / CECT 9708 / BC 501) TaxID=2732864 RepID=I4ETI7_MODI5|nr:exported protein of unknown function [Modestobacter marinus]